MKTIQLFVLTLLITGFSFSSYAGGKDDEKQLGIRAGYQLSNIYDGSSSLNSNGLSSFYVGFFREQKVAPLLSFGTGFEYSQIGSMQDSDNKIVMHYLSIPVNFKVKLGPVYALAGASAAFKVADKWTVLGVKTDPIVKANWFDVPVHVGVGVQVLSFRVEARYHWGMLSLYESPLDGYKNQAFQLGVGIAI